MASGAKAEGEGVGGRTGVRFTTSPVVVLDDEGGQVAGTLRSQDIVVEVFEVELKKKGEWVKSEKLQWTHKDGTEYMPPEDIELLPNYTWITNWRIDETSGNGQKGRHGWEYASKQGRFSATRVPRIEKRNDKARRRRWLRVMIPEQRFKLFETARDEQLLRQVQQNLERLQNARMQIEVGLERHHGKLPANQAACAAAFKQNIQSLGIRLDTMDQELTSGPEPVANTTTAMLKKLRNDLRKEEGLFQRLVVKLEAAGQEANGSPSSYSNGAAWAAGTSPQPIAMPKLVMSSSVPARKPLSSNEVSAFARAAAAPPKKGSVAGRQGAFDPSALISSSAPSGDEEGVLILRDEKEQKLWQKFIPEDELTTQTRIIEERDEEIQSIYQGMVEVNEAFKDLQEIVTGQAEPINAIHANAEVAYERAREGYEQITEAARLQESGCTIS